MTNTEIRIAAQKLYNQYVTAVYNDSCGEDDGTMNILCLRLIKACAWAKENNEYETMKSVCGQMFITSNLLRYAADEAFKTIFNN